MPKRPSPDLNTTAFSIARQLTGPPFSVMLESAELHRHLLEEIAHPGGGKAGKARKGKLTAESRSATAGKAAVKHRQPKPGK
jgi:hypothetical protein